MDNTNSNWAVNRGIARSNGALILCFSRPLDSNVAMAEGQVGRGWGQGGCG